MTSSNALTTRRPHRETVKKAFDRAKETLRKAQRRQPYENWPCCARAVTETGDGHGDKGTHPIGVCPCLSLTFAEGQDGDMSPTCAPCCPCCSPPWSHSTYRPQKPLARRDAAPQWHMHTHCGRAASCRLAACRRKGLQRGACGDDVSQHRTWRSTQHPAMWDAICIALRLQNMTQLNPPTMKGNSPQ